MARMKGFAEGVSALHGAMNERFELAPDKCYSDTAAISSRCRGRALAGWCMEEDAVLKLHSH